MKWNIFICIFSYRKFCCLNNNECIHYFIYTFPYLVKEILVITLYEANNGDSVAKLLRMHDICQSTISDINKQKYEIQNYVLHADSLNGYQ